MGAESDDIRRLVKEGLDHYAVGETARAVARWREVLAIDPGHAEARDYLRAAEDDGVGAARPGSAAGSAVADAVALVRRGEPGEALDLLQSLAGEDPDALEAHAHLELVRAHLVGLYSERVGSGEGSPRVVIAPDEVMRFNLPSQAGFLLSLIDGCTSVDDLLTLSGMDPFEALQALAGLLDAGIVEAAA